MHEGVNESLRKMCKHQQNVRQHYYLFDTLVTIFLPVKSSLVGAELAIDYNFICSIVFD